MNEFRAGGLLKYDVVMSLSMNESAPASEDGLKFGERAPSLRKNVAHAAHEPIDFGVRRKENAAQHQTRNAFRAGFRVSERERRSPRTAEQQPTIDAEVHPKAFEIGDQMGGRVVDEVRNG